jgi:CubicO group peptidase (beta-lactamase class C family)
MRVSLLLAILLTTCLHAADSREDLAPLLQAALEKEKVPSFAAAVVRGNDIIAAGVAGVRKAGSTEKVTLQDKYHIGSCTKSMTALLAVLLDAEKVISLTNRVGDILKDWEIPDEADAITLKLLLQNRSGMGNKPKEKLWGRAFVDTGKPEAQRRRFLEGFLRDPLEAEPGSKFIYSNVGFALAGAMLETAAHKSWEQLMEEKIFARLKLTSAGFGPPSTSGELDQPWGHVWKDDRAIPKEPGDNPVAIAPAGLVHMSILDCAHYAAFHLAAARGEVPELRPYRDALYTAPEGSSYAMGWGVSKRGWAKGKVLNHAGSNTMFFTVIWIAPERNFACVVSTNVDDAGNDIEKACDGIVGKLIEEFILKAEKK